MRFLLYVQVVKPSRQLETGVRSSENKSVHHQQELVLKAMNQERTATGEDGHRRGGAEESEGQAGLSALRAQ